MEEIAAVLQNKKEYLDLLLLADPSESMIDRYLGDGSLYVMKRGGQTLCAAVVLPLNGADCELKNLAVAEPFRRQGFGSRMIAYLAGIYAARCKRMFVGTSEGNFSFYEKNGFRYSHLAKDFFAENYPEPIVENGAVLADMTYFVRDL